MSSLRYGGKDQVGSINLQVEGMDPASKRGVEVELNGGVSIIRAINTTNRK